jgi:hypothetical protein
MATMSSVIVELVDANPSVTRSRTLHATVMGSSLTVGGTALAQIIETMVDAASHAEGA